MLKHPATEIVKLKTTNQIGKIVGYTSATRLYKIKIAKDTYLYAEDEDLYDDHKTFLELNYPEELDTYNLNLN